MNFEEILKKLTEKLGAEDLKAVTDQAGDPYVLVPAAKIVEILSFLKTEPSLSFETLSNLTGVDAPPDELDVVYHLFSYTQEHSFTLKVRVPKSAAKVSTVEGLYPGANWLEREAYDLLGVVFEGHSDLRRILLPDDWEGHPLRKDYEPKEDYHGIETTRPSLLGTP
ncbi:MAG: NADH-quinone oxidoreductase subunit C [Deltaproteobacteria bacterium]|nr:NADH-quinone oxidoreductase subunit C [Deltaproteobacteria bacterium]